MEVCGLAAVLKEDDHKKYEVFLTCSVDLHFQAFPQTTLEEINI